MKRNELFTHYSMSECFKQEEVLKILDDLTNDGKIEYIYEMRNERFKLIDLELNDEEIYELIDLFYDSDVVPDLDYDDPVDYNDDMDDLDDMGYFEEYE